MNIIFITRDNDIYGGNHMVVFAILFMFIVFFITRGSKDLQYKVSKNLGIYKCKLCKGNISSLQDTCDHMCTIIYNDIYNLLPAYKKSCAILVDYSDVLEEGESWAFTECFYFKVKSAVPEFEYYRNVTSIYSYPGRHLVVLFLDNMQQRQKILDIEGVNIINTFTI